MTCSAKIWTSCRLGDVINMGRHEGRDRQQCYQFVVTNCSQSEMDVYDEMSGICCH